MSDTFFNGKQKRCQTKALFVEFICSKVRCYLKFENNEIFTINNDNTVTSIWRKSAPDVCDTEVLKDYEILH